MGWLFACFGYSKKRKRLKKSHRIHSQHKEIGSYQPLESSLCDGSEGGSPKPIHSNLKRRKQSCKDQGKARIRKKVRFDLNVIAYEPVPDDDDDDDDLRSILCSNWGEEQDQEAQEEEDGVDSLLCTGNSIGIKRDQCNDSTYRYSNCYEEEEEETGSELDDLEEEDEDEDDEENLASRELKTAHGSLESRYVNPVLIPIENLSQWRAIKMKRWEIVA